jgi:hypothetical protein
VVAITGYYIDRKFEYHECLIDFKRLEGHHTGEALATFLLETLDSMRISHRIFCITTDAASNNLTMMDFLQQKLRSRGIIWNAAERHIFCIDHVINLCVQAFLKSIQGVISVEEYEGDGQNDEDEDDDDERPSLQASLKKLRRLSKVFLECNPYVTCKLFLPYYFLFK